jgi:hypothetical protein
MSLEEHEELTDEEKDGVIDLIVHPAAWPWIVRAIKERGLGVSPALKIDGGSPVRIITVPPSAWRTGDIETALGDQRADGGPPAP